MKTCYRVKSVMGNASLETMLTEIRKLRTVWAVGLPAGLFADVATAFLPALLVQPRDGVVVGW